MKIELRLNKLFVALLVLGCTPGFVACDDDENIPTPPTEVTPETMFGDYTGKMLSLITSPTEAENEGGEVPLGVDVSARVDADTVYFDSFPIKDIVLSIVKDEEMANEIVEAVGDVDYKIGYESTLTEAKDSIKFVLAPEPLKLSVSIPAKTEGEEARELNIEVKITPVEGASYEVETTSLKFKFNAEEILMGEGENQATLPGFTPTTFDFNMEKSQE